MAFLYPIMKFVEINKFLVILAFLQILNAHAQKMEHLQNVKLIFLANNYQSQLESPTVLKNVSIKWTHFAFRKTIPGSAPLRYLIPSMLYCMVPRANMTSIFIWKGNSSFNGSYVYSHLSIFKTNNYAIGMCVEVAWV